MQPYSSAIVVVAAAVLGVVAMLYFGMPSCEEHGAVSIAHVQISGCQQHRVTER